PRSGRQGRGEGQGGVAGVPGERAQEARRRVAAALHRLRRAQRMTAAVHVFGVRHLSPGGAWHLRATLDAVRPKVVLIEGLADADALVPDLTRSGTKPPVAILAYTDSV